MSFHFYKAVKTNLLCTATAAALLLSPYNFAATQGSLGANSTGDFDIVAALQDLVQISRLDDLNFGLYPGSGDLNGTENFCVYRNGTGAYEATLTGSGPANSFEVSDGGNSMPYTVTYDDGSGPVAVTTATAITGRSGHGTLTNCGNADNAAVNINVQESNLQANPPGNYIGTLTIVIGPE